MLTIQDRIREKLKGHREHDLGEWAVRLDDLGIRMNGNQLVIARLSKDVIREDEDLVYYALKQAAAMEHIRIVRVTQQSSGSFTNEAGHWYVKRYRVIWNRQKAVV